MQDQQRNRHCCPHEGCSASFCRPYRLTDHLFSAHTNVVSNKWFKVTSSMLFNHYQIKNYII